MNTLSKGNNAALLVEIAGNSSGYGLTFTMGGSTVRGLVFNEFQRAIWLDGPGENVVEGNFIGL